MRKRSGSGRKSASEPGTPAKPKPARPAKVAVEAKKALKTLDPTRDTSEKPGPDKPAVESVIRRAQGGGLPGALLRRFIDADLLAQSAALAFYAVLSLAPLLLLLLWFTASAWPSAQADLLQQVGLLVGIDAERVARGIVENARAQPDTGSIAGWWSMSLLFVGATAVFAQLQDVLNKIFRTDATRLPGMLAWLRKRVFSFGVVFAVGFLLLVSMTVNTAIQLLFARMEWVLPLMATFAAWLIYSVAFAFMYHYLPDRRVDWRRALGGGALTALLFVLGRSLIGWYLENAEPGSAYGSMGTLVVALLWVYYAGLVVFVGALLTAVIDERSKARGRGSKAKA